MADAMHEHGDLDYRPRGAALALVLATERLIAQHGSAGVSLREITEAAGAANTSATQYHFGSREALLLAVFRYRMAPINAGRLAYLDTLARSDQLLDQRHLIGAMIYPLAEGLMPRAEGNYYVRFLERRTREGLDDNSEIIGRLSTGGHKIAQLLKKTIAYFPETIVEFRLRLMMEQAISGLAAIEANLEQNALADSGIALHVELLIDASVALLSGPVSIESLRLLAMATAEGDHAQGACFTN